MTLLAVENLSAGYGAATALHGLSFSLGEGEAMALMGRNGMGKTTTLGAIMGLVARKGGAVRIAGRAAERLAPHRIARLGVGLAPEGRRIFPSLSVSENLRAVARPGPWTPARVSALFPRLGERAGQPGGSLSGGEQQMLAIGRALVTNPRLLMLDEATEGLAPLIRADIWAALAAIRAEGVALIVVDKHVEALGALCDKAVALEGGRVAWEGDAAALAREAASVRRLLTV